MYILYILKSIVFNKSYVGITNDLQRRVKEHNQGKHAYTKRYVPWKVMHQENFPDRKLARTREKYLKSAAGRKLIGRFFNN